jgi:hypothetical protein
MLSTQEPFPHTASGQGGCFTTAITWCRPAARAGAPDGPREVAITAAAAVRCR